MELHFLGTGSAYSSLLGNTSAYFIRDNTLFLLDCGETVFTALNMRNLLNNIHKAVILITHFHADHCGSLPTLVSFLTGVKHVESVLVNPVPDRLRLFLNIAGTEDKSYQLIAPYVNDNGIGDTVRIDGISITPYRVQHSENMPSFGYVLADESETIFYSGDAAAIPTTVLNDFLSGNIHHLYVDCCLNPSHDHGELKKLCATIPMQARNKVTCMHLAPNVIEALLLEGFHKAEREA